MEKIKILIADDHSMVREGLKQLIELEEDIEVVAQAGNGIEAIEKIEAYKPDIVLLDINMPVMNGLEVIQRLKDTGINTSILIADYS